MDIDLKTATRTTRRHTVSLHGEDIVELLRQELKSQGVKRLPTGKVEVHVSIPGGGDWSNTNLTIDDACPVVVNWEEIEEED